MSRINKWKLEKAKVKVVFRLQFHATHIPQTGWDKLFISFISADTGKAIAKTTKAIVRNGTCKWADPIYETTRLLQDTKSKQLDEKLYKIVVAMGSSRASTLGEATVNLADYVDALKPSSVALPLVGCNFGTILHVTVQLLTSKTGFREFEQQRELREGGKQSGVDSTSGRPYSDEIINDQTDKVSARVKLRPGATKLSSPEEEVNLNEDYADSNSAAGFDGSSNTSESLHAEKHELDCSKSNTSGDIHVLSNCQSPVADKRDRSEHQNSAQGSTGSDQGWVSNYSVNNGLAVAWEENIRLRGSLELAESSIFNLKLEVSSLQSLANELGTETQKFSHLLAAEISSSEELAREVSVMKSECLNLKDDIMKLQDLKLSPQIPSTETSDNQFDHLPHNMQLQFLKGITVVEAKILELQKEARVIDHDRGSSFISSELEALLNMLLDVKRGIAEATAFPNVLPSEITDVKEIKELCTVGDKFVSPNGFGLDLCQPESIFQHSSIIPPVTEVANHSVIDAMKGQIFDLVRELDQAKIEKEALTRKMNEMECYYESLVVELEENQKLVLGELQLLRNEHSTCLYTLSASRAEIESMHQDMNEQMLQFANERREMGAFNKELERRATTSEAALRRARLNYSIAVDKLQKDLELLSSQVVSMFETNENLIKQAFVDPSQTQVQRDHKFMQNPEEEDSKMLSQNLTPNLRLRKRSVGGDILLEDLKRSFFLQEELYQKAEEELSEMYSLNLNLYIYSKVLQEFIIDANADTRITKKKLDELAEELELSTVSQNQLMVRLQKATEDIHTLNEYKSSCTSHFSDMTLQNQLLEDKIGSISKENYLFAQKLKDSEMVMTECRSYQSKFETCLAENTALSLSLKQEELENEKLQNEISLVKGNVAILRVESDEVVSLKEKLEEDINFVQDKLANLLSSYSKQLDVLNNSHGPDYASKGIKDAILQLEEIQQYACDKILQLMEENQSLERVRLDGKLETEKLQTEISHIKENLAILRADSDEVISSKKNLEEVVNFSQDKLGNLLASYHKQIGILNSSRGLGYPVKGMKDAILQLEESQQYACDKILQLIKENQNLERLRVVGELENEKLQNEISLVKEHLAILRAESDGVLCFKENLQEDINFLQDKLDNLLVSYSKQVGVMNNSRGLGYAGKGIKYAILHLEEIHQHACDKFFQLMEENRNLERERVVSDALLSNAQLEILAIKQRLKSDKHEMVAKLHMSNALVGKLQVELESLATKLQFSSEIDEKYAQHSKVLLADLTLLEDQIQEVMCKKSDISEEISVMNSLGEELGRSKSMIAELNHDKKELVISLQDKTQESVNLASEIGCLKEYLRNAHDALSKEKAYRDELEGKVRDLTSQFNKDNDIFSNFEQQKIELLHSMKLISHLELEKSRLAHILEEQSLLIEKLQKEISHQASLESQLFEMHNYSLSADVKQIYFANHYETALEELLQQLMFSEECRRELQKQYHDLQALSNHCLAKETHWSEEKESLLTRIESLRSDLETSETQNKILSDSKEALSNHCLAKETHWSKEKASLLARIESLRSDFEASETQNRILSDSKEALSNHCLAKETHWSEEKASLLARIESLGSVLEASETQNKLLSDSKEALSNQCLAKETHWSEEKASLLKRIESLRSDFEACETQNKLLSDSNNDIKAQLEECKRKLKMAETSFSLDKVQQASEIEKLKNTVKAADEEINYLNVSKEELEILVIAIKGKVIEQSADITLLEEYKGELMMLRAQCSELSRKLSEQVLKTEEFRNLSTHLKELKDKAEAERVLAREKRGEAPSVAAQDSLRIAFMKEQYETKIQELKQQLAISKKHGEEMLLKLQDAIDEIEDRKKSEAVSLKRNEEISLKLLALEEELQSALTEKRENIIAYDRTKAELECALLSLECCKEEKEKLEASMQDFEAEKSELAIELTSVKGQLESLKSRRIKKNERGSTTDTEYLLDALSGNSSPIFLEQEESMYCINKEDVLPILAGVGGDPTEAIQLHIDQDATSKTMHQIPGESPRSNGKNLNMDNEGLGAQVLRSSMEHLHEELEKMKNENIELNKNHDVPGYQVQDREIMQLQKTNEELRSMFPLFNEVSGGGNALERVLALEMELAEALKAKNKSNIQFQSSFLKQHSNDEAVARSFRDINELIKEMLELKGRHSTLEAELREMHDRYSQLSLQFAEVEGERQKLKMTLKNVRSSKKLLTLNRSSSANVTDHLS